MFKRVGEGIWLRGDYKYPGTALCQFVPTGRAFVSADILGNVTIFKLCNPPINWTRSKFNFHNIKTFHVAKARGEEALIKNWKTNTMVNRYSNAKLLKFLLFLTFN